MTAVHRAVLLVQPFAHVVSVRDAVAIGNDQRRPVVGLGLAEGAQGLLGIGAERDARHVHVGVGDRLEGEVLRRDRLARGGELRDRPERRRLRHLPAGVGVHLGVHHQHVDVLPARQHMIEPARADVVRPAVATDDPHAAANQVLQDAAQVLDDRTVELVEPARERRDPLTLGTQLGLPHLRRGQDLVHQLGPDVVAQLLQSAAGELGVAVGRESKPQPELGVVLEQRVRPRRTAPGRIHRPRRRRLVSAVDRRAACCVGDRQPVAEQLREQLHVRRLAAARRRRRRTRTADRGTGSRARCRSPRGCDRLPAAARRTRCSRARSQPAAPERRG